MSEAQIRELLGKFGGAWNDHDLDAALALTTEDVVFESTGPAPDGVRSEGREAVRAAWEPIFADASSRFDGEELFIAGDRVVQCWTYRWAGGHVRGVDVFRIRDGKVAEKLSYVKG
jgi:ketosteroid isomerase-like protein